jgi:uncharacterized protein (TIGR02118 family)
MPKLVFLCRRRPDLTHERYAELLLRGHVPLALRHHPTMRKYVVNVVEGLRAGAEPLDSIGELTFDTLDDFRERLYDSDEGRRIIERDVAGFMGGAHAYVTTEHVQKAPTTTPPLGERSPGAKIIGLVRRPDGMTHDTFVEHWLRRHVPLALRHHPGLHKYVTNVVDARLGDGPEWDGIAELHFPSRDVMRVQFFDSPEGERIIREDMRRFIGGTWGYDVAEYVQPTQDCVLGRG